LIPIIAGILSFEQSFVSQYVFNLAVERGNVHGTANFISVLVIVFHVKTIIKNNH